jgi:hypothetical protein
MIGRNADSDPSSNYSRTTHFEPSLTFDLEPVKLPQRRPLLFRLSEQIETERLIIPPPRAATMVSENSRGR